VLAREKKYGVLFLFKLCSFFFLTICSERGPVFLFLSYFTCLVSREIGSRAMWMLVSLLFKYTCKLQDVNAPLPRVVFLRTWLVIGIAMHDVAFMFIMLTVLLFTRNIQQESLSNLEMKRRAGPSIVHLSNGRRKTLFKVLLWKFCHSLL